MFGTMTRDQLRSEARSRGLKVAGSKQDLVERLAAYENLDVNAAGAPESNEGEPTNPDASPEVQGTIEESAEETINQEEATVATQTKTKTKTAAKATKATKAVSAKPKDEESVPEIVSRLTTKSGAPSAEAKRTANEAIERGEGARLTRVEKVAIGLIVSTRVAAGEKLQEVAEDLGLTPIKAFGFKEVAEAKPIVAKSDAELAKIIVKMRDEGIAWHKIAFGTGIPSSRVRAIYTEQTGVDWRETKKRAETNGSAAKSTAKKAAPKKAAPAARKTATKKATASKAKATSTAATKLSDDAEESEIREAVEGKTVKIGRSKVDVAKVLKVGRHKTSGDLMVQLQLEDGSKKTAKVATITA